MNQAQYLERGLQIAQTLPDAAEAVRLRRPVFLAQMAAMAAMLAMRDEQNALAAEERFLKARDATILADAANKGILNFAKSAELVVAIKNKGTQSVTLTAGRLLYDESGLLYRLLADVTISPDGAESVVLRQQKMATSTITITDSDNLPFLKLPLPTLEADYFVEDIRVRVGVQPWPYTPDFLNVAAGDIGYTVEVDLQRRMFVRFGANNRDNVPVFGQQLAVGDVVTIDVLQTAGRIKARAGSKMGLDYAVNSSVEDFLSMTVQLVRNDGAMPLSIDQLAELCKYPSFYDHDAVYLSNYAALLLRYLPDALFLGVSNEQSEAALGRDTLDSIRALYVTAVVDGASDSQVQDTVRKIIVRSDNAKRVIFRPVVQIEQQVTVRVSVSASSNSADVGTGIRQALLSNFGRGAPLVRRGGYNPFNAKAMQSILTQAVPVLREAFSDVVIEVQAFTPKPEEWRYLTADSIEVVLTTAQYGGGGTWNF